jgi:hypothetical protein
MLVTPRRVFLFAAAALVAAFSGAAGAEPPPAETVLTVSGAIDNGGVDGAARFDMPSIEALPARGVRTRTPWTYGVVEFVGVPLADLLRAVGAKGQTLHMAALNDYAVDVPTADAVKDGPIVAYRMNSRPMSVREKGPLWIIYPYDDKSQYQSERYYSRSIWQLTSIDVR